MPLTSSVMRPRISNFRLQCCSKKIQMLRKKVKLLLEQLQVCIFAEIVFGVRCTLSGSLKTKSSFLGLFDVFFFGSFKSLIDCLSKKSNQRYFSRSQCDNNREF